MGRSGTRCSNANALKLAMRRTLRFSLGLPLLPSSTQGALPRVGPHACVHVGSGALARQSSFRLRPNISMGRGIIHQHGGMAVIAIMRTTLLDNSRNSTYRADRHQGEVTLRQPSGRYQPVASPFRVASAPRARSGDSSTRPWSCPSADLVVGPSMAGMSCSRAHMCQRLSPYRGSGADCSSISSHGPPRRFMRYSGASRQACVVPANGRTIGEGP